MKSSNGTILEARNVHKNFGGVVACAIDHLEIEPGRITSLIGPNGAGKTTFFDVVTGFQNPESGELVFDGEDISGMRPHAVARKGLVRTFQLTKALSRMTVFENMILAAPDQIGERIPHMFYARKKMREQKEAVTQRADELLDRFALTHLREEYAGRLSGGQKKLLELARALMVEPTMVLLDEPMAGVNRTLGAQLLDYVHELRDGGMTFLLVEHDMDVVMRVSERVVVMALGRIIADGLPEEVQKDQAVIDAYLGEHADEQIAEHEAGHEHDID